MPEGLLRSDKNAASGSEATPGASSAVTREEENRRLGDVVARERSVLLGIEHEKTKPHRLTTV